MLVITEELLYIELLNYCPLKLAMAQARYQ